MMGGDSVLELTTNIDSSDSAAPVVDTIVHTKRGHRPTAFLAQMDERVTHDQLRTMNSGCVKVLV